MDLVLYVVNNHERLRAEGSSIVLYLPKIETAGEAALRNDLLTALELHLGLAAGSIKVYVLVERIDSLRTSGGVGCMLVAAWTRKRRF